MDPHDLVQDAVLRALARDACGKTALERLESCMSSISSTKARTFVTAKKNGYAGSVAPGTVAEHVTDRAILPPDEKLTQLGKLAVIDDVTARIVANDDRLPLMFDALADGERGKELQERLGLSEREQASLRRKLIRRTARECQPYCDDGRLDFDPLLSVVGCR